MGYFISKDFQDSGPYEVSALKDMAKAGQIGEGFWAREDGSPDWIELTKLPALKGAFSAKAKPASAPAAKPPAAKPPAKKK